jgi:hypothetical protein
MQVEYHDIGHDWSDLNCDKFIDNMKAEAAKNPGKHISGACGAWTVIFSTESKPSGIHLGNVFSARVKRSTSKRDWMILGRMTRRIGAPQEEIGSTILGDPNATHYWIWGGTATPDEIGVFVKMAQKFSSLAKRA